VGDASRPGVPGAAERGLVEEVAIIETLLDE
jgi:hypothetical protein